MVLLWPTGPSPTLRKAFNWYATRDDQFNVPVVEGWRGLAERTRQNARPLRRRNSHYLARSRGGRYLRRFG